jgi:hypothetical protein
MIIGTIILTPEFIEGLWYVMLILKGLLTLQDQESFDVAIVGWAGKKISLDI